MELKNYFAQDLNGNILPNPTVYVYQPGTTDLVTGLRDSAGFDLSNPFTGGITGQIQFSAPDGDYDMRVVAGDRDFTMRVRFSDSVASVEGIRNDLASTVPGKGAELVGFRQDGDGAVSMPLIKKARQWLHNEDYNFLPDSGDVTENGLKLFFEARRSGKKIFLGKGDFYTSGVLDLSGVTVEGIWSGYENSYGTRIIGDGSHTVISLSQTGNQSITACVKNIAVEANGADVGILSSYQVNSIFENIVSKGAIDAFQCGEPSRSGPLWVQLRNVVAKGVNRGLVVSGYQWANANLFDSCLFTGGIAGADIFVSGGYGAISNNFINTEFAGAGVGIRLNGTSNTVMNGCYYESYGPSVHITGRCYGVALNDGTYSSPKNDNPIHPSVIYHDSSIGARIFVRGGYVVGDGSAAENITLISSNNPSVLTIHMMEPPVREMPSGFKLYGEGLPSRLGMVNHSTEYSPVWTAQSVNPVLGNGTLTGRYTISGKSVSVDIDLLIGSTTTLGSGSWFFSLPFLSASNNRSTGTATIEAGGAVKICASRVNNSSTVCFVLTPENSNPISSAIPIAWSEGNRLRLSVSYCLD